MAWDRQPAQVMPAPAPPVLSRWLMAAFVAMLLAVLLFLLHVSGRVAALQVLDVWIFCASPLLIWALAFGARTYRYGGALAHFHFLQEQAQAAQQSWQDWAHRSLAVHASCVVLPDQVCASTLMQDRVQLPPHTGQARRIAALPPQEAQRAQAGLQLLLPALAPVLKALPEEQLLQVSLLSDAEPEQFTALHTTWEQYQASVSPGSKPSVMTQATELSYRWIEEKLKAGTAAFELIVVLQVHGKAAYSDGLAMLLLCPDSLATTWALPLKGHLMRPMPLDIEKLPSELPLFLQTQTSARLATGQLLDSGDWPPLTNRLLAAGKARQAAAQTQRRWVMDSLCGVSGPLNSWLLAALAIDMAQHQQQPLLLLGKEQSQHWIGTVTSGEMT